VANAILYDTVANVAAIPASPANNDAVEVVDSTGIESFTPLSGKPVGYVGDSGLSVRLVYTTSGNTWNWIQYFPNDPENRYGDAIVTLQGDVTAVEGDVATLQSDVLGLDNSKAPTSNPTFTGAVKVADGTAAAPSITFASDTNLGLYRISENKMGLTSNGALVATIDDGQLIIEDSLWAGDNAWIETSGKFAVYQSASGKGTIRFYDADASNYVSFEGPVSISSNVTWTLPSADGSSGQFLKTNGSGVLSWDTVDTSTLAPLASPTFTGTVTVGSGTTAQRPATAVAGMFRFNTDDDAFEGYDGTQWGAIGGAPTTAPPVVNSVTLAEVNTAGARFTSKDFSVTTTMVDDGTPVSQKGVKAYVEASLQSYPATASITANTETWPTSVSFSTTTPVGTSVTNGSAFAFAIYPDESTGQVRYVMHYYSAGGSAQLYLSSDGGSTWVQTGSTLNSGSFPASKGRVVGDFLVFWSEGNGTCFTSKESPSTPTPISHSTATGGVAFDGTYYYFANNTGRIYRQTTLGQYGWTEVFWAGFDVQFNGIAYNSSNGVLMAVGRQTNASPYPTKVYTSTDGVNWTARSNLASSNVGIYDLFAFNGYFFVSVADNTVRRSTSGSSWTTLTTGYWWVNCFATEGKYLYGSAYLGSPTVTHSIIRSTNNGTNWSALGSITSINDSIGSLAVGYGSILCATRHSASPYYPKANLASYDTQVLTFSSNTNLGTVGGINVQNLVRMSGTTNQYGRVISINSGANQMTIGSPQTWLTGRTAISVAPVGSATSQRLYLNMDTSGNISDMQSADPGFVNYGPGTSVTLRFPATFPTGNAPDTELPAGTTIRAEIQATNSVATDTELSNIVTPT